MPAAMVEEMASFIGSGAIGRDRLLGADFLS